MVNSTSGGGHQDPPQGSGTVAASTTHVSTSTSQEQEIAMLGGSAAAVSSQAMPENTTGTIPISSSTTMPQATGTNEMLHFSTSQVQSPRPFSSPFDVWRPGNPYGMPYSYLAGSTYTAPNATTFSPNTGSVGQSAQNAGTSSQLPLLTTNSQATFRQEMDASNHDMLGAPAKEIGSLFTPLVANMTITN
ncbi:cell wall integrity and stress response component 1-like [Vicia villosa]|uniref:cell wall integrity and stress response component 1-like n=1 Tax=Vicia villosa TaxID=3911 RepID=UPI00273B4EBA|nr:cell wall integrity and stress response component 1-like [Vicia villosa]